MMLVILLIFLYVLTGVLVGASQVWVSVFMCSTFVLFRKGDILLLVLMLIWVFLRTAHVAGL